MSSQPTITVPQALQLLELEPGASLKQIRAAYKRLALQLHPDKQHKRQQQSADATSEFARLSAAYSLLVQGCNSHTAQQQHHQQQHSQVLRPFETAYATGSLFSEQFVDEAVLSGAAPADILNLQQLVSVAAQDGSQLAQHLAANPPTAADEQLWLQVYTRMELRQQARQQQAQQSQQQVEQGGVGITDLLSDLLLRPSGQLYVQDETDGSSDEDEDGSLDSSEGAAATATVYLQQQQQLLSVGQQPQQQQQQSDSQKQDQFSLHTHQQVQVQAVSKEPQQHSKQRLRHGWGFYWMWLRRALLAKAVVSVLSSSLGAKMYEHRFPEPLPL